jgi:hypothetical protein
MKKIYLMAAAALMAVSAANARTISMYYNGEEVASGSTLKFTEPECYDYSEWDMGMQYTFEPHITYSISETGALTVRAKVLESSYEAPEDVIIAYSNCGGMLCADTPDADGYYYSYETSWSAGMSHDLQQHFGMVMESTAVTEAPKMKCTSEVSIYYTDAPEDAVTLTLVFDNTSNSVAGVEAADNAVARYFNLQGMEIKSDALTPGIYIRRQGNKAEKIYLK